MEIPVHNLGECSPWDFGKALFSIVINLSTIRQSYFVFFFIKHYRDNFRRIIDNIVVLSLRNDRGIFKVCRHGEQW